MPIGPLVEETDETARRMIDINLHGVIFGTKLALERFLPRGRGHIVNIASQAGKGGYPRRRHLLRDQACGRRALRGGQGRGGRDRDRGPPA